MTPESKLGSNQAQLLQLIEQENRGDGQNPVARKILVMSSSRDDNDEDNESTEYFE